jgi:hypothetical protein
MTDSEKIEELKRHLLWALTQITGQGRLDSTLEWVCFYCHATCKAKLPTDFVHKPDCPYAAAQEAAK